MNCIAVDVTNVFFILLHTASLQLAILATQSLADVAEVLGGIHMSRVVLYQRKCLLMFI